MSVVTWASVLFAMLGVCGLSGWSSDQTTAGVPEEAWTTNLSIRCVPKAGVRRAGV